MSAISREEQEKYERFWYPLSYFFGAWLGDGHYVWDPFSRVYQIGLVSMDTEILEKIFITLRGYFKFLKDPCVYEEISPNNTKIWRYRYNNKVFTDFVCRATAYKTMLPDYIWNAPKEVQLEMLSGLMDTDGTIVVQKDKGCLNGFFYTLKFSGCKGFVKQFPDLCRVIGINITSTQIEHHSNPNHSDRDVFNISLPSAVDNGFQFHCKRKQERLNDYLHRRSTAGRRRLETRYGKDLLPSETTRQTTL